MHSTQNNALAHELLDTCSHMVLAMTLPDGTPYCVPLSPARKGETLYFHSGAVGLKLNALRTSPKVCLTCADGVCTVPKKFTQKFRSLVAFGTATEVMEEAEKMAALTLICEKYCPDDMADLPRILTAYYAKTAVWRIALEKMTIKCG